MKTDTDTRATAWSVTLFNDEQKTDLPEGWRLEGQLEIAPDTGRKHYQGLLHTPQVRFSTVKKVYPKAHIEKCRDKAALRKYVHKAETRAPVPLRAAAMNFTKFFEDVFEYTYRQTDKTGVHGMAELLHAVKTDGQAQWLSEVVSQMIQDGASWDYAAKACDPKIKSMWQRYRVAFHLSWLHEQEAAEKTVAVVNIPQHADDDTSIEQDSGGSVGEVDDDQEVGPREGEADSEGDEDGDSGQSSDSGDSESDSR